MVLAALLGASLVAAETRFQRAPEKVETEDLGELPLENQPSERRKWIADASRRASLAALDTTMRWRSDAVDTCVRAAGVTSAVSARVDVSVGVDGAARAKGGGDERLAGCVVGAVDGEQLPLLLAGDVRGKYTVAWSPAVASADSVATEPSTGPSADAAAPADGEAKAAAFAPRLDEERGFANLDWGDSAEGLEGASSTGFQQGTTLYARLSDTVTRWFGAKPAGVAYAFGADGLHSVVITVEGTTAAWRLREALTARYGPPEWDNRFEAYFWRGERVLLQLRPTPGSEEVRITLLDIARARASGLADRMPGDPVDPTKTEDGRRLPRIFREK